MKPFIEPYDEGDDDKNVTSVEDGEVLTNGDTTHSTIQKCEVREYEVCKPIRNICQSLETLPSTT